MKVPRGRKVSALLMAFCLCCISFSSAFAGDVPNKKEIITKARQSYYNLRTLGLAAYTCEFDPNWDLVLTDLSKTDPDAADKARKSLKQLQFSMTLGADNKVEVMHTLPLAANAQDYSQYDQLFSGMEQMMTGFFQTSTPFVLSSPFPDADGEYQLEDQGAQYLLTYKDSGANVATRMNKDLVISNLTVTSADNTYTLDPQFLKNPKGLLLSGYAAAVKTPNLKTDVHLNVGIAYQEIDGLQVPEKLNIAGSYGETSFVFEMTFTGYQITKK